MHPGETPQEALIREVTEETGFTFEFAYLSHFENNGKVEVVRPHQFQIEEVHHHGKHMNFVFIGKITSGNLSLEVNDEDEKLRWFSAEELRSEEGLLGNIRKTGLEALAFYSSTTSSSQNL